MRNCVKQARKIGKKNEIINDEKDDVRPIQYAVCVNNLEAVRFLLHNSADINAFSHRRLSFFAKNVNEANVMNNCDSSSNSQEMQGFTALHLAFFYCRLDIAKLLFRNKNIDIDITSVDGKKATDVIGGYDNSNGCRNVMQETLSIDVTKADCKVKLISIRETVKVGLDGNCAVDSANSIANLPLSPTKANKIELEASNTTNLASSTVDSSFAFIRTNLKEASSMVSSAVRPSSFINSIFSWIGASTTAALDRSTSALPSAQQSVVGEINFSGATLLTDIIVRKFTGEKYSRPLDDSFLTVKQIKERKLNSLERDVKMALSKCEKLYQRPGSSLNNLTAVYNFKTSVQI